MPSRFETRAHARAIPLVTVTLANGHLRQSRNHNNSNNISHRDQPPSYDTLSIHSSESSEQQQQQRQQQQQQHEYDSQVATHSPSNADLTEAVLHLSRTLAKSVPPSPPSSWFLMMVYSWSHNTRETATRLYHILAQPSTLFKELSGATAIVASSGTNRDLLIKQQQQQPRKSIQQMTEEQDRMDDDPDMTRATELVPVSMSNTRKTLLNDDSNRKKIRRRRKRIELAGGRRQGGDRGGRGGGRSYEDSFDDEEEGGDDDEQEEDNDGSMDIDGHSTGPKKPKRRMERYSNPFGSNTSNTEALEDDEGWLGRGEECSEWGQTKSNSVRLVSTARMLSTTNHRRQVDYSTPTSSLGQAMYPQQYGMDDGTPISSLATMTTTVPTITTRPPSSLSVHSASRSSTSSGVSTRSFATARSSSFTEGSLFNQSTGASFDLPASPATAAARARSLTSSYYQQQQQQLLQKQQQQEQEQPWLNTPSTVITTSAADVPTTSSLASSFDTPSSSWADYGRMEQDREEIGNEEGVTRHIRSRTSTSSSFSTHYTRNGSDSSGEYGKETEEEVKVEDNDEDEYQEEEETLVRRPKDSGHHSVLTMMPSPPPTRDDSTCVERTGERGTNEHENDSDKKMETETPDGPNHNLHTLFTSTSAVLVDSHSTSIISSSASISSSSESGAFS
ncbi:hypothetical protein BG004_008394 [Podila humilis]|nr:hypothetical protein BG004_008394 [Podila humilis]